MSFHKTKNVNYECVYSTETENEYLNMYSMLSELNSLCKERDTLKAQLKEAETVIELGDYWDELKVNDYLNAREEYKTKHSKDRVITK